MSEQNNILNRHLILEVWNGGNFAIVDDLVARDFVGHTPLGEIHGHDGYRQFYAGLRKAFPDLQVTVEDQFANGDKVVSRWTARGTHQSAFQGIPTVGAQMKITGITIVRIANGKVLEQWTDADMLSMFKQLGALPAFG